MSDTPLLITVLDFVGVFVFAASGGTLAARRKLDVFGVLVMAAAAALAGGIMRDVLIGAIPPASLKNSWYAVTALAGGTTAFFCYRGIERMNRPVMVLDAIGLGLFAVTGSKKALAFGLDPLPAVLMGVLTAVGGGAIRDLLLAEVPRVLREEIYALAALVGAAVVVAGHALGLPDLPVVAAGVAAASLLRIVSVARGWRAPTAPGA